MMKKLLALVLFFVLLMSFAACSAGKPEEKEAENPIIGTWQTGGDGNLIYEFKENGKIVLTVVKKGSTAEETKTMEYTYNEKTGELKIDDFGKVIKVKINECFMDFDNGRMQFGRVYGEKDSCGALNDVLGNWVSALGNNGTMKINKDGTVKMTLPAGSITGIYIYNPDTKELKIPEVGFRWKLEETDKGMQLTDIVAGDGFNFVKE